MRIQKNIPLNNLTTFGIGGPAEFFVKVRNLKDLKQAFGFAKNNQLPITVLGGGSNVLINDAGVKGLVVLVANNRVKINDTKVVAGAGAPLDEVVEKTLKKNLRGLENLSGIPGTIGGAVFGNAGMWSKYLSDNLVVVDFFNGEKLIRFSKEECGFATKHSVFKELSGVIWLVHLRLEKGTPTNKEKLNLRQAIKAYRDVRYPPENRTVGSFFKNVLAEEFPQEFKAKLPGYIFFKNPRQEIGAGFLIESAGLPGRSSGGAIVLPHQANCIVNFNRASAEDVINLAQKVQKVVFGRYGVRLKPEVQLLGFEKDPLMSS